MDKPPPLPPWLIDVAQRFPSAQRAAAAAEPIAQPAADDAVSIPAAAIFLGVSERSIARYLVTGKLRRTLSGRSKGIRRDDLERLKRGWESPVSMAGNKITLGRLKIEIGELRGELHSIREVLGLQHQPLELPSAELAAWAVAAERAVNLSVPDHDLRTWAEFVVRLRYADLETLRSETGNANPWTVFLRLAGKLRVTEKLHRQDPALWMVVRAAHSQIDRLAHLWVGQLHSERELTRRVNAIAAGASADAV